jgi:predicted RNA-binding protein
LARRIIAHIRAAYPLHVNGVSDAINYALRFTSTNDPVIAERVEEEHREER